MLCCQKTLNQVQGDGGDRQGDGEDREDDERVDRVPNGGVDRAITVIRVRTIQNEIIFQFNNISNKYQT